ncbi:hypothetical protein Taro_049311 [Colocasia esculenta]|uniref:U3 small nucleolar RNA-associated protein 14 n=1 Tax=Colocasia esculenta TaxID=4460 RepID=A0A843XAQ7_COLES|nr:hypothetical protein [Colocasia esculenta]
MCKEGGGFITQPVLVSAAAEARNSRRRRRRRRARRRARSQEKEMKPRAAGAPAQLKRKNMGWKKRKMGRDEKKMRWTGPRLPSALRKELDAHKGGAGGSDDGSGSDAEERGDMYEYEEGLPEEDTGKNRRFDPVENLEYELPDDFKDENLPSDEEAGSDADGSDRSEGGGEDEDRHLRMLQGITGMPGQAFQDKRKKETVFTDVNGADGGATDISIQDLLDPLHGMPGYSSLRKKLNQLEKKSSAVQAPLPKVERERLERKVAYEHSKKDMTNWEPLVKRNREAPTIYFEEDKDIGFSTVGAIASEFQPRTEFEKKMALLVGNPEILEAHQKDGSRLLELNKISVEDVKDRQNRLAKMRSLLFRHEMKAKHIKKIKSKTYHRMMKKSKLKATSAEIEMDPEAIREQAMKQEFKRAEERMTLKHKNSSKWAKRIMKRGLNAQDEGSRAAIAEQLQQHALLTRKINSMKDTSSSEDSSDDDEDDDELPDEALSGGASKLLTRAKEKTLKVIEEEDEMPKSGVLSLPFMVRGLKKKNEALLEESRVAIQEYDSSLRQLDNGNKTSTSELCASGGRKVFGATRKETPGNVDKVESDDIGNSSDSEAEFNIEKSAQAGDKESSPIPGAQLHSGLSKKALVENKNAFENFDDINRETGPKTTYDVAIFVSDSFKKIDTKNKVDDTRRNSVTAPEDHSLHQDLAAVHDSDMDSDEEMVDGFLSSGAKLKYELPSQADLVRSAFAGDDVEGEFEKQKMEVLDEEVPEPEKPVLLPGWGEWTNVQQKKGLPKWILNEHEDAKRKREEALKKRKDAHLKHVIISEKIDKKADKLLTKTLPFPFTSKEVFEQSIRMPIGPEYNPAISHSALNRPAVVKRPGTIIKPIQFEEVDPHEKSSDVKQSRQNPKRNKAGGKPGKASFKGKKAKV